MNEDKIFDQQIRNLLYDAEEKAPRRVWDAVSARIASRSFNWWPVAGLAFASFAIALVLPSVFDSTVDCGENVCADGYYSNAAVERFVEDSRQPALLLAKAEVAPAADIVLDEEVAHDEEVAAEDGLAGKSEKPAAASKTKPVAQNNAPDPFSKLEDGNSTASRPRFFIGGTVCGGETGSQSISKKSGGTPSLSDTDVFTETGQSTYGLPFTIGLGVSIPLGKRFCLNTGIDYSLLTRTYECSLTPAGTTNMIQGSGSSTLHYLGVPLKLNYSIIKTGAIDFYALAGGEAEFCVSNKFSFSSPGRSISKKDDNGAPQFSVGVGLGVEFNITKHLGIYIDPEVNYFIPGNHPKSIRTDKPLMFRLGAGLRFNL